MNLIDTGIEKGLIRFDEDQNFITYVQQNKKRNYNNPEEKVQAETFLTLVLIYGYPEHRIKQFLSVQMGAETKEADIAVYSDDACEETYILVECKKEDLTDQQFNMAVDQAYSYAVAEGAKYVWTTSRIKNQYYEVPLQKPKSRIEIPDIPQFGINKLAPYKYVKGGISQINTDLEPKNIASEPEFTNASGVKQKFFELQVVSENELTKIFIQSHQALWGGGQRNPSVAFDELDKLIFCKIWDEKHPRKNGDPYDFQIFRDEDPEDLLKRIKKIYAVGEKEAPEVFKDGITLTAQETLTIVKYFQRINLNKTDLDSKGKAFETFMGSYFRGDFGQYFTPRPIVKFIVDSLPIMHKSRVLDTSCGSGGFLLYALDKVREQANEFYDPIKDEKDHYKYWHDFAEKNLFGIEINDQIARTAKMNMIIHDDGHTNVIASDGLLSDTEMQVKSGNKEFKYNSFDFIITNPPFGSSIKQTEKAYLHQYNLGKKDEDWLATKSLKYGLRDSQSTEVLFLEQCHNFLIEHGYLAVVIPDGILTNSSMQYVRDNLEEMYRIVAVVSMPQTAFSATGAGVKSSVLFLRKHKDKQTEKISNQKAKLKEQVKTDNNYIATVEKWEKEKANAIKKLEADAKAKNPKANKKEITEIIQADKSAVQSAFTDKVNLLKEELTENYFLAKQTALDDYPIFMAIAEDIGYDATGRSTNNNELTEIGVALSDFIAHINKTEK
ncbi:MAG: N-6 DNA methylase [Cytophagales bacterium CG12_big_fil_rev_8_21_14_0_65_40_12]|nr:MAG: N-6 DNA methylase [Cytophagales bacterium CG12_big_fil_rev_8_21_14_0_65_40_12]PIW03530.1 MAG: restriction endonuclease subunit M [Cytophagales bacterium CG17_big_fil_post_rev_8_21_14_2_50_40_13]